MSATSALEGEDLEHVTLVRMEDVQPDRNSEIYVNNDYVIENDLEYDHECVIEDDSNVGSMVSVKWEEMVDSDSDTVEYIVPDKIDSTGNEQIVVKTETNKWPTLEILPGGVIKDAYKYKKEKEFYTHSQKKTEKEMSYACGMCPLKYKYLFCLVKHVKWHEEQRKHVKNDITSKFEIVSKLKTISKPINETKKIGTITNKRKVLRKIKSKCKIPKSL